MKMKKEIMINEIMEKLKISREDAEKNFIKEICKKYCTSDVKLAESMFLTELK